MRGGERSLGKFFYVPTRDTIKKALEDETGIERTMLPGELPKMMELASTEFQGRPLNLSHDERKVSLALQSS
jgi:hypothetical protein